LPWRKKARQYLYLTWSAKREHGAVTKLTPYEQAQADKILSWKRETPGIVEQAVGFALSPISSMLTRMVPPALIESLLRASDWLAEKTLISPRGVAEPPAEGVELVPLPGLEILDEEAERVRKWAIAYAGGEGAVAGVFGLFSLPVDIPAVITLSLRTIRRVGLCYGYAGTGEEEKRFVLGVLSVAGANSMKQKVAALTTLRNLEVALLTQAGNVLAAKAAERAVSGETALLFVRDVAEQLGVNLTQRRALAAIPIIGAAVGGAMNAWYVRDIGQSAQRAYQERWLRDRGHIIDHVATPPDSAAA